MGTYLIAGASSGIGAACAKELADKGHTIVLVARDMDKMEKVAVGFINRAFCFSYDLDNVENIKTIFEFCTKNGLKLDGMVYSAGMSAHVPMKVCSSELFARVMRVNCLAFAEMGKYFFSKRYSNEYSRIVAISSVAGVSCNKGMGPYNASKAALNAVVKTMSKEFVKRGILVNALLPARVLTPMVIAADKKIKADDSNFDMGIKDLFDSIDDKDIQPLGMITPEDIAKIVSYLVSRENRYITGALIPVSAGRVF